MLINQPHVGFERAAANLLAGMEVLQHMDKFRLADVKRDLAEDGLVKAVRQLHLPSKEFRKGDAAEGAVRKVLKHFGNKRDADDRLQLYGHLADAASRLYVAAMSSIEVTTMATSLSEWARRIPDPDTQLGVVRKFIKSGGSEHDLVAAVAKGLAMKFQTGKLGSKQFGCPQIGGNSPLAAPPNPPTPRGGPRRRAGA